MRVMKFEDECINNMEWFESGKKIHSIERKTALTFLLPMMFDGIDVTINESGEVWSWLHQKYVMIQIRNKLHSIKRTIVLTFLLPVIFYGIDVTMNYIDDVWR